MSAKASVEGYFHSLNQKTGWDWFLAEDMVFTSFNSPARKLHDKGSYLEATKGFYSFIVKFEVKNLLVDGGRACALTPYTLRRPEKPAVESDVAEIFRVQDGKIVSFDIYFDRPSFSNKGAWRSRA